MPYGDITPNFSAQIGDLSSDLKEDGDAPVNKSQSTWVTPVHSAQVVTQKNPQVLGSAPDIAADWTGSPFDITGETGGSITGMSTPFYRRDSDRNYIQAVQTSQQTDGGRVADRMTAKMQIDYLATMERAFRLRHATSTRCALHAASRRSGQGASTGVFNTVMDYIKSVLHQGYKD